MIMKSTFRCTTGVDVVDTYYASITAEAKNGATCSEEGMVFDGNDDYVDVTPWAFGGEPITVEYLKYDA